MNQDMKDVKFTMLTKELIDYLGQRLTMLTKELIDYLGGRPNIIVADGAGESNNSLIKSVVEEALGVPGGDYSYSNHLYRRVSFWCEDIKECREDLTPLSDLLKKGGHRWSNVFWNLFLLSIDDNIYNNEAENVADLAAIYHFTPEMMEDWCNAVNYVLSGKRLSENCDLICKTEAGKIFFLHQKNSKKNSQKTPKKAPQNLYTPFLFSGN